MTRQDRTVVVHVGANVLPGYVVVIGGLSSSLLLSLVLVPAVYRWLAPGRIRAVKNTSISRDVRLPASLPEGEGSVLTPSS